MDDPYGRIGDVLIFRYPISCPFGRPGYWHNLELIHMGLCEPRVAKSLVDFLCPFVFQKKNATRQFLSGARRSALLRRLSLLTASPRVTR